MGSIDDGKKPPSHMSHNCHSFGNYRKSHGARPQHSRETQCVYATKRVSEYDMSFSALDAICSSLADPKALMVSPSTSALIHTLIYTNVATHTTDAFDVRASYGRPVNSLKHTCLPHTLR